MFGAADLTEMLLLLSVITKVIGIIYSIGQVCVVSIAIVSLRNTYM